MLARRRKDPGPPRERTHPVPGVLRSPAVTRPAAADVLTGLRLAVAPVLPVLARRPAAFVVAAGACALSDAVDGALARRAGTAGPGGARLDSVADAAFVAGLLLALRRAEPDLARALARPAVGIAVVRGAAAVVGVARWGRPVLLHTWSDKAAGGAVVGALVAGVAGGRRAPLRAGLVVAVGAAVEELWLVTTARAMPDTDARGVLGSLASRLVARGARRRTRLGRRAVLYDVS